MNMGASIATKGPCVNISTFLPSESSLRATELKQSGDKFPNLFKFYQHQPV